MLISDQKDWPTGFHYCPEATQLCSEFSHTLRRLLLSSFCWQSLRIFNNLKSTSSKSVIPRCLVFDRIPPFPRPFDFSLCISIEMWLVTENAWFLCCYKMCDIAYLIAQPLWAVALVSHHRTSILTGRQEDGGDLALLSLTANLPSNLIYTFDCHRATHC